VKINTENHIIAKILFGENCKLFSPCMFGTNVRPPSGQNSRKSSL